MARRFLIPIKDLVFDLWQNIFYALVQANLALWLIPVSMFNLLTPFKTEWDAAWAIAKNKDNRSKSDVARKNQARKKYIAALRTFIAACINYNPLISDEMRTELGLPPHDKTRTHAPIPDSTPLVELVHGKGNNVIILMKQQTLAEGDSHPRSKPEHVHHMDFCYKIECNKLISITRTNYILNFTLNESGKRLYAFGRWVNTRNQPGAWTPMYITIVIP